MTQVRSSLWPDWSAQWFVNQVRLVSTFGTLHSNARVDFSRMWNFSTVAVVHAWTYFVASANFHSVDQIVSSNPKSNTRPDTSKTLPLREDLTVQDCRPTEDILVREQATIMEITRRFDVARQPAVHTLSLLTRYWLANALFWPDDISMYHLCRCVPDCASRFTFERREVTWIFIDVLLLSECPRLSFTIEIEI